MPLANRSGLPDARRRLAGLNAGQDLFCATKVAIGRNQQSTQRLVSAALQIVKVNPGLEAALCLAQIKELLLVEQFPLNVGVEDFQLAVVLRRLGDNLINF